MKTFELLALAIVLFPIPGRAQQQSAESGAGSDVWVTVRMTPNVAPGTLDYLSNVTEPNKVVWKKGESVQELLRRSYGVAPTTLQQKFVRMNHVANAPATEDKVVDLPPGPSWLGTVRRIVTPGEAKRVIKRETGFDYGPSTRSAIKRENKGLDIEDLTEPRSIAIPNASRRVSFKLKDWAAEWAAETPAAFQASFAAPGVNEVQVERALRLVPHWTVAQAATGAATACPNGPLMKASPIRAVDPVVLQALQRPTENRVTIAILDSGIDTQKTSDDPPKGDFPVWRRQFKVKTDVESFGTNFGERGKPLTDTPYTQSRLRGTYGSHGTHVAGLASGRLLGKAMGLDAAAAETLRDSINHRIQLMIEKVTVPNQDAVVLPTALEPAITEVSDQGAQVANLSLGGDADEAGVLRAIRASTGTLFVVAAGNGDETHDGVDIGVKSPFFPALYEKQSPDNVITVGANDGDDKLACFSNYGAEEVDLVAPGVAIDSTIVGGTDGQYSGTSQATPLVSFAAAMLYSLGVKTPKAVKERILSTVEVSESLEGKVATAGELSLNKALQIDSDLVEMKSPQRLRRGVVTAFADLQISGENSSVSFSQIRRIRVDYPTTGLNRIAIVKAHRNGDLERLRYVTASIPLTQITFLDKTTNRIETVPLSAVRDIILSPSR
jgi:subtilisin family serine protease